MAADKKKAAAVAMASLIAVSAEGLRHVAYRDPPGILTVCYGSTTNVISGKVYSLNECRTRLNVDMQRAVEEVDRCQPGLPENVLAAFSDAAYNMGPTIACNRSASTAARYLHAGRIIDACNQLIRWDKARIGGVMVSLPGLTKRREQERELCLKGLT